MALPTILSLVIKARDEASGVIGKVAGGMRSIMQTGQALKSGQGTGNALADQMGGAVLKANLMTMALEKGFNFAHQKAMELKAQMGSISQLQMQNLSAANSLKSVTGLSMSEAKSTMTELTTELAKAASAQPGSTDDYLSIFRQTQDNVAKAFIENGKLNKEAFSKNAVSLAADYGSVGATSGTHSNSVSMWLARALGGASVAQLKDLEFGMNNPTVMNMIEEKLNAAGVKGLNELTDAQRVALLVSVGKVVNSDEMKREGSKTIDGMWQSFNDKLFGQQGGMFTGFFKNLDKTGKTDMSVAAAFTDAVAAVIGEGGLFDQLGKMFSKVTGINADTPMEVLRMAIIKFTTLTAIVNHNLTRANIALNNGVSLTDAIAQTFGKLASNFIKSFGTPEEIGAKLAGIVNSAVSSILGMLSGVAAGGIKDGGLASGIGSVLVGLLKGFGSFLANLDPAVYATVAAGILTASAAQAALVFAGGLVAATISAVAGATVGLPVLLIAAAVFAMGALAKVIYDNWDQIAEIVNTSLSGFGSMLKGMWQQLTEMAGGILGDAAKTFLNAFNLVRAVFTGDINGAIQAAKDLVSSVTSWFNRLRDTWATLTGGKTTGQLSADQASARADQLLQQAQANKAAQAMGPMLPATAQFAGQIPVIARFAGGLPDFISVGARFLGQLPVVHAAGGLLSAATQEAANKPPGSGLVVANTSEFILTPAQMSRLMQGSASVAAQGSAPLSGASITFAPQFVTGNNMDVEELSREVLRMFQIFLDETISSQLTS